MRKARGLLFTSTILFLLQLPFANSSAQTALVKAVNVPATPNIETVTKEAETSPTIETPLPIVAEESKNTFSQPWRPVASALSSKDPRKLGLVDQAYLDAFTILNDDNECSRLFGGRYAISALNEFVHRLKPAYLDHNVAIRMSGAITTMQSNKTGFAFRAFDKTEINMSGSFFQNSGHAPVVSNYQPNTRESRVVVLLHELGHMVKGSDDNWVLPDDGTDRSLSVENTRHVVSACRKQIESVSKIATEEELKTAAPEK
ncbi:MAG TPA: hypothetical protein VI306_10850 [Pyrinomonadaceae bacterium]